MSWDDDLLDDQRQAASHVGAHARLIAGPGTGKTLVLTRRICYLVEEQHVAPEQILALTFTRAAAHELRQRVGAELGAERRSRISTLHSFSLRELLRNATLITALPQPLRIAEDWEERNIILEGLKAMLDLERIENARELFNELSADWQSLTADEENWDQRFPNPAFLGAWREHRQKYGYVVRAELVYQLKRAMEQHADFRLEGPLRHLLVDEYQDLNRCDLAVVKCISDRDTDVVAAGDDDQSIYGFRKAHPEGIRRFPQDYVGARDLGLSVCKRCAPNILELGLFVARQDYRRIEKPIHAEHGRDPGHLALLSFPDQTAEGQGVASVCRYLMNYFNLSPDQILILLRSDHRGTFSSVLRQSLEASEIPVVAATAATSPLDEPPGRQVLAILRVFVNREDHLAWRSLFQVRQNNLGSGAIAALYDLAIRRGEGFAQAARAVENDSSLIRAPLGTRVQAEVRAIQQVLDDLAPAQQNAEERQAGDILVQVDRVAQRLGILNGDRLAILQSFREAVDVSETHSINSILTALETSNEDIEQEIQRGKVNILTMHKAKGLTSEATIIAAAEDEYIPGRAVGDAIGDERRLLYVSLTRAKQFLYVTYCNRRTGSQRHTGRTSGRSARNLTQFLRDAPLAPQNGMTYIAGLLARP